MPKYTFNIVCSEDAVGNHSTYKRIKLVGNVNGEEKTIKFCGPYFEASCIHEQDGKEMFTLWVEKAKYNFCGDNFCNSWTDGEFYSKENILLEKVKLKVILDEDCEYKIAVSVEDNQWITLPKSSLFGENLNLEKYYNRELSLLKGGEYSPNYYIPKVMYGQTEICELVPLSFPICNQGNIRMRGTGHTLSDDGNKIVVEKNGNGEPSIYFTYENGDLYDKFFYKDKGIIKDYVDSVLKAVLLENSNIEEVLPELGIDVITPLERKVKCLVNKMYSKVAERVAHLEAKDNEDREILANNPILQEGVAEKLRENPGNAKGPKGEQGPKGDKGDKGDRGDKGTDGISPDVGQVATELVTNKKDELGKAVLEAKNGDEEILVTKVAGNQDLRTSVADNLKGDGNFKESVKGDPGPAGPRGPAGEAGKSPAANAVAAQLLTDSGNKNTLVTEVAGNPDLRTSVADNLKGDGNFKESVKGDPGPKGDKGEQGLKGDKGDPGQDGKSPSADAVAVQLLTGEKKDTLVTEVSGNPDLRTSVADNLKGDGNFKESVKGDPGPAGPRGPAGEAGKSPAANAVAAQLLTGANKSTLITEVASNEGLQEAIAGNQVLKDAVTTVLNGDNDFHNIIKRAIIDSSTNANNAKQKFTLQKGEKLLDDTYEANIVSDGKTIATLPKIGYYMLNDQLVVCNHVTKEEVAIPRDFHYLKVIKFGSGFSSGDYKLTFCNVLGNEFFEYKKYDPQYSNVSDEYKFINLNCAKKEYNPNLSELLGHRPSFFIIEGPDEPGSPGHYQADVFELTNNNKGRKMATLIDKFCYFNENDQFKCCNYHKGMECRIYDTSEINQEYRITDANSKFSLTGYDDVTLHANPELI